MSDTVLDFYQHLAQDYHLIYADWLRGIERQSNVLERVIRAHLPEARTVLDCACGIGTQAIGLARRGYTVHATDLSPAAVERAAHEAAAQGIALSVGVADFRTLAEQVPDTFDVVLACDNSLPHLIEDADLRRAAENMRDKLRPGGLLLLSIRDYDHLTLDRPRATMPQVLDGPDGPRIVFQVWDWAEDGRTYAFRLFILRPDGDGWRTTSHATTYRALLRAELNTILADSGFEDIRWHMPHDTGYHQPIVTARPV